MTKQKESFNLVPPSTSLPISAAAAAKSTNNYTYNVPRESDFNNFSESNEYCDNSYNAADDAEFQIAMNNLQQAKSRYLPSGRPPPPPSTAKPPRPNVARHPIQPQPLPPVPTNITLKRVPQRVQYEQPPVKPYTSAIQHTEQPPVFETHRPSQDQRSAPSASHAAQPPQLKLIHTADPVESAFSPASSIHPFSPIQLAKLPDFNFDDEVDEAVGMQRHPYDSMFIDNTRNSQQVAADVQSPTGCANDQIKVAVLPATRPSAINARRQLKNQYNYPAGATAHSSSVGTITETQPATSNGSYQQQQQYAAPYEKHAEDSSILQTSSNPSITGAYSTSSQAPLNTRQQQNQQAMRFILISSIVSFKGLVKRNSRFIGTMQKLGRNKRWQKRTFTIDHTHLVCFKEGSVSQQQAIASRDNSVPTEVSNHLQWDSPQSSKRYSQYRIIKWILSLDQVDGIYLWQKRTRPDAYEDDDEESTFLERLVKKLRLLLVNPCSASRLIETASLVKTDIDIGSKYEWVELLGMFKSQRKVSMDAMKQKVRESEERVILLTTVTGHFHLLKAESNVDLYNWCTLLTAKKILLCNNGGF